jgi:branched-subunit amino acid aminotransferase/4-amino-4-deoxychorismate lyase
VKWLDGALLADDAPPTAAIASAMAPVPFETLRAGARSVPLLPRHLARLHAAAARLRIPCTPPPRLEAAMLELLAANQAPRGIVRISLLRAATTAHWLLQTRPAPVSGTVRLLPCLLRRPADAPPADLKAEPRSFYDGVLAEARAGTADDGIVLSGTGELLETAVGNLFLLLDGVWTTPPLDGRVLPGIARALVLEHAAAHGLRVAERRTDLVDLHRASALVVTNAVHGPRPAALVGTPVGDLDSRLVALWRNVVPD